VFQTTGIREGIRIEIGMGEVDRSKPSSSRNRPQSFRDAEVKDVL